MVHTKEELKAMTDHELDLLAVQVLGLDYFVINNKTTKDQIVIKLPDAPTNPTQVSNGKFFNPTKDYNMAMHMRDVAMDAEVEDDYADRLDDIVNPPFAECEPNVPVYPFLNLLRASARQITMAAIQVLEEAKQ